MATLGHDDLRVELFLNAGLSFQWLDCTSYVRQDPGVSYTRGYSPDSTSLNPGLCDLTLDNRTGRFSPRNTTGPLYGSLGRNVPMRVSLGTKPVARGTTAAAGTTAMLASGPTDTIPAGSTIVAAWVTSAIRNITLPAAVTERVEIDSTYSTFSVGDGVDADGSIADLTATVSSPAILYGAINCGLPGTWTFQSSSSGVAGAGNNVSVNTANGQYVFVVQAWSADPSKLLGPPQVSGPYAVEWALVADSGTGPVTAQGVYPHVQGWWAKFPSGTYTVVCHGDLVDCDTYIALYQSSDAPPWSPRFAGVIREWPVEWDESGNDSSCPVQAMGGIYQGRQDSIPQSIARTVLARNGLHYWPMEDSGGPGFTAATAGTPRLTATITGGSDTAPVYATSTAFIGSAPLATFSDAGAYAVLGTSFAVGTSGFKVAFLLGCPSTGMGAGANIAVVEFGGGTLQTLGVEYTSNTTFTLKGTFSGSAPVTLAVVPTNLGTGIDGKSLVMEFHCSTSGANVTYGMLVRDVTWSNGWPSTTVDYSAGSTFVAQSVGNVTGLRLGLEVGSSATLINQPVSIGHVVLGPWSQVSTGLMAIAATGGAQAGYHGWPRIVASPTPAAYSSTSGRYNVLDAGPIVSGSTADRTQMLCDTEQAMAVDAAGFAGLNLVDRSISQSSVSAYDFTYSNAQLANPLEPADDDLILVNRASVARPDPWGESTYELLTGPLGVTQIGPYSESVSAFPNTPDQTADLAEWVVSLGTVDVQRWPAITVEWSAPGNAANVHLPNLTIGRWITLAGLPSFVGPDVQLQIVGIRETVDTARVRTTYVTRPAEGWRVLVLDDASFGLLQSASPSRLDNRIGL